MKFYSLLLSVLLIASCSNEWKEYGYGASETERAKKMGFENPVDYKEAIDLGISSYRDLSAYRFGEFENLTQFKYAQNFYLKTLSEVKNHITSISCVDTPNYGQVCSTIPFIDLYESKVWDLALPLFAEFDLNQTSYDELGPRLEFYLTRANELIDGSSIEVAIDCSSSNIKNYRTVFILSNKTLISPFHFDILRRDPIKKLIRSKGPYYDIYGKMRLVGDYNLLANSKYEDLTNAIVIRTIKGPYHSNYPIDGPGLIKQIKSVDSWDITDDFHYLHIDGRYNNDTKIQIDRKTGIGKEGNGKTIFSSYAKNFECKPFKGDVKIYLKNDVLKPYIMYVVKKDIERVNRIKAEELAKKKKEEERAKMENKV